MHAFLWNRCGNSSLAWRLLCIKDLFLTALMHLLKDRPHHSHSSFIHSPTCNFYSNRTHVAGRIQQSGQRPKNCALFPLICKMKGVSHTYLTALRLRHFSPEEHAAGRVLNSHKSQQKICKVKEDKKTPPSGISRSLFCLSSNKVSFTSQAAMVFRNSKTVKGEETTPGPICIAAAGAGESSGFHGAKVCSPPVCFPGEQQRKRHHLASAEMR